MEMKVTNLDHPVIKHTTNATSNSLPFCKNIGGIAKGLASDPTKEDPDGAYDRLYRVDGALCDQANYETMIHRKNTNPSYHWGFPYITGYNYKFHHRHGGSDWSKMQVMLSGVPTAAQVDKTTYFHFNRSQPIAQLT